MAEGVRIFGKYRIDEASLTLLRNGSDCGLSRLSFRLLVVLFDRRGKIVPYEELSRLVWQHEKYDEQHRHKMQQAMQAIKRAIGEKDYEEWVENYVNRGYLFARGPDVPLVNQDRKRERTQGAGADVEPVPHEVLVETLAKFYPDPALNAQGLHRYSVEVDGTPIRTNIATKEEWLNLSLSISHKDHKRFPLVTRSVPVPEATEEQIARLKAELHARNIEFRNRPIYCLQSITPQNPLAIASFSLGMYADHKLRWGLLEDEIAEALRKHKLSPEAVFRMRKSETPLRFEWLQDSKQLANFKKRPCGGGTNVLFAFRRPDREDFQFYVKRRPKSVSSDARLHALVPGGMHQPSIQAFAEEETSIASTVYREMLEEMFRFSELEKFRLDIPLYHMERPQTLWFRRNPKKFVLEIVSFGLNLMDGTYEIDVLIAVDDVEFWRTFQRTIKLNWEVEDVITPLCSTMDQDRLAALMLDPKLADVSRFSLVQGLLRLAEIRSGVSLPPIKFQLN